MSDQEEPVDTGTVAETQYNPIHYAEQRAAMKDWERKRPGTGTIVPLPNSEFVRVQQAMPGAWYPGEQSNRMLGDPSIILLKPKPPWDARMPRYVWFVREDTVKTGGTPRHAQTNAYERSGRIRYVEEREINAAHPDAVYEIYEIGGGAAPDGTTRPMRRLVTSGSLILAEILDPKLSYGKYKAWDDYAIQRQQNLPASLESVSNFGSDLVGHIPGRTGLKVEEFASNPKQGG